MLQEAKGRGAGKGAGQQQLPLQEALRPLVEEQRTMNQRIAKLNHSIEVYYQYTYIGTPRILINLF